MSLSRKIVAACLAGLTIAASLVSAGTATAAPRKVVGAYYASWASGTNPISAIPTDTPLTHLFYSFSTIEQNKCVLNAPSSAKDFADIKALKQRKPGFKAVISIGGWGAAGFSDAALTAQSRKAFVASCVDLFFRGANAGVFDGIDLDWEFPVSGGPAEITDRPEDKHNMTLLTKEFRKQLGSGRLVTGALPTGRLQTDGQYDPAASFELGELARVMDFINVMTYDMGTGFSSVATFNAPLRAVAEDPLAQPGKRWNNVVSAIDFYQLHGVPASKMVLGVPFYGRGFVVKQDGPNHGLYQGYDSTFWVDGAADVQRLKATAGWQEYWHPTAQSPWLYNAAEKRFVSFENSRSIGIRADFAKRRGLLGTFMWELSNDDAQHSLLTAMAGPFR